jgi:hypothetical protein
VPIFKRDVCYIVFAEFQIKKSRFNFHTVHHASPKPSAEHRPSSNARIRGRFRHFGNKTYTGTASRSCKFSGVFAGCFEATGIVTKRLFGDIVTIKYASFHVIAQCND